jgi:dTDP-3-amino-3,4,6-trideoxy-alpha-D-glucose transaminase
VIPQADPSRRIARHRDAVIEAITAVVDGHEYILGSHVERFEEAFASSLGAAHGVGVNSGTDAIALALRATGIGRGDEVLVPALTAAGTAAAVLQAGATPRFVDVELSTRCLDLGATEAAVSGRTAAILAVHLHGHPIDMPRLLEIARHHSLAVIEDCAQAHGASFAGRAIGTFGTAAAFSFYPTKNLGCIGDGGAVITSDPGVAERVRSLRNYGWQDGRRLSATAAGNSRLDALQAAILLALLPHLDAGNAERRVLARRYREMLADSAVGLPAEHPGCVYHQFAITVARRDEIRRLLRERHGIGSAVHYDSPLHLQPAFADFADAPLPVSERLAREMISLPIQPEIANQAVDTIAAAVRSLVGPAERKAA